MTAGSVPEVHDVGDTELFEQCLALGQAEVVEVAAPIEPARRHHSPAFDPQTRHVPQVDVAGQSPDRAQTNLFRTQPAMRSKP